MPRDNPRKSRGARGTGGGGGGDGLGDIYGDDYGGDDQQFDANFALDYNGKQGGNNNSGTYASRNKSPSDPHRPASGYNGSRGADSSGSRQDRPPREQRRRSRDEQPRDGGYSSQKRDNRRSEAEQYGSDRDRDDRRDRNRGSRAEREERRERDREARHGPQDDDDHLAAMPMAAAGAGAAASSMGSRSKQSDYDYHPRNRTPPPYPDSNQDRGGTYDRSFQSSAVGTSSSAKLRGKSPAQRQSFGKDQRPDRSSALRHDGPSHSIPNHSVNSAGGRNQMLGEDDYRARPNEGRRAHRGSARPEAADHDNGIDFNTISELDGADRQNAMIQFGQDAPTEPPLHNGKHGVFSLREVLQWRFLNDILARVSQRRADHTSKTDQRTYLALVVDCYTRRSLDSVCESYDLFSQGVTVVESLEEEREDLPLEAVYFISPTQDSLEHLANDFKNESKPKYRRAHVFMSHGVTDEVMQFMTTCTPLMKRVRNFVDANFGFVVQDGRSFHFDDPMSLMDYVPIRDPDLSRSVAERLVTVCLTLNEKPQIRYYGASATCADVAHSCHDILQVLHPQMMATAAKLRGGAAQKETTSTSTVLVLDRSVDFTTALMHDYHYESMCYDVLDDGTDPDPASFNIDTASFFYDYQGGGGKSENKEVFVNDADDLWRRLKHDNIVAAKDKLFAEVKDFAANHATSRLQRGEEQDMHLTKEAIRALPEYQEMLSGYYAHVALCEKNLNALGSTNLVDVWDVEQDVVTGVDRNGNELSTRRITKNVLEILNMPQVTHECKFRLLLLYYTMMENVTDEIMEELREAAELKDFEQDVIDILVESQLPDSPDKAFLARGRRRGKHKSRPKLNSNKDELKTYARHLPDRIKDAVKRSKKNRIDEGRYVSYTEEIITSVCNGKANVKEFPFVEEPKTTAKRGAREQGRPKLIVFIIGGVTMAEIRAAHVLSEQLQYDIIIGGTGLVTPKRIVSALKDTINADLDMGPSD